jgi:two-component system OmpR family sensor kinase
MRFSSGSLRGRIIWSTAIVSGIAMLVAIGTMIVVVIGLTQGRVESGANNRFDAAAAILVDGKDGNISQLDTAADQIEDSVWVFDLKGQEVAGPTAGSHVRAAVLSLSRTDKRRTLHRGEHFYVAAPVKNHDTGTPFAVVVATQSFEPYEADQRDIIIGLIVLGLVVTAGTTAIAAWIVRRTLEPVASMTRSAADWSERDLDSRFDPGQSEDEIAHLGSTLNLLLDRVARTIRAEQVLTSELAHELRTPLTAIRGEAELGVMANEGEVATERLGRIVELADRLDDTITTLLALARGQEGGVPHSRLASVVESILDSHHVRPGVDVDVHDVDDGVEAAAPSALVERALAPLLDNALRHARSAVIVSSELGPHTVRLIVSDDGPGIEHGDTDEVFRAGSRSSESPGSGLGLALSRRVARTLGGDIILRSPADPTAFVLELPRR